MSYRAWVDEGYRVFPLHGINPDGSCECGREDCKSVGKHPTHNNWQHTPVWDEDQLDTFDELGWMDSGYGIIVSDGLLIIDVDPRNGGLEGYARLAEDVPAVSGAGLIVETGRKDGGKHLSFKAPHGVALVQSLDRYPGVDFKSSGFVVGPGSLHASGKRYDIVIGDGPADITDAPPELIEMLRRPDMHRTSLDGEQIDVTDDELSRMIKSIDPDCGHDEWVRVGMALHEVTGGTGFEIWDKWSRLGKKYPGRDVLDKRWHSFGKSATRVGYGTLHKYATQAGWQEPVTFDYQPDEHQQNEPVIEEQEEPAPPKQRHQMWLDTLMESRLERVNRMAAQPWVITDIVPAGGVVSLVGGSGVGKSFVAVDMACSIASGAQWHGYDVEHAGSVVYVAAEGGGGIDKRVLAWAQTHGMDDVPNLHMLLDAPIIDDQKDAALVAETLAELSRRLHSPVRMVILDTLNRVMQGEENSATAMAALMRGVEMIRQRLGCAVQIIHHTGHGEQQRARGSSAFFAALDSEITIKQIGAGVVELENTKSKDSEAFEPVRLKLDKVSIKGLFDRKGRPVTSLVPRAMSMIEEGVALGEMTPDEQKLLEIVEQIGATKPYDDDLRKAFYDDMGDMAQRQKRDRYRNAVDGLVKKGRIRRDGKDQHGRERIRVF